ncbi:MAG: threonine synthase [Lachnospiraceae bacterium]|nr:threonine synthase [Lachnospiraceae bacterium]
MSMIYQSTRGKGGELSASMAIIRGLSDDGGLFVPKTLPSFDFKPEEVSSWDYRETAFRVMRLLLDDYSEEELRQCIDRAYDEKFDTPEMAPLQKKGDRFFLELFHGKTIAFKDMALSILPHLLTTALKKNGIDRKILILTATSGDTGKAALAGFSDVPGTAIIVFYPKGGVSRIQELQMVTEKGKNTRVFGVRGNFDDCQSGVKAIFNDASMQEELSKQGFSFSSANSINIGRLVPQIVYYVYAYGRMVKQGHIKAGDKLNFSVPTGNFGNILAAWYAKRMGLPIGTLICASNQNNVLYDFLRSGIYDKNRPFILTSSPSMDILISSNLERLIYHIAGEDAAKNSALMASLRETGRYEITKEMEEKLADFYGAFATEEQVAEEIRGIYKETGYVIDPHTAVAAFAQDCYRKESSDTTPTVIVSTASPYKFAGSVYRAIQGETSLTDDFEIVDALHELSKTDIPAAVSEIRNAGIVHQTVTDIQDMPKQVLTSLSAL